MMKKNILISQIGLRYKYRAQLCSCYKCIKLFKNYFSMFMITFRWLNLMGSFSIKKKGMFNPRALPKIHWVTLAPKFVNFKINDIFSNQFSIPPINEASSKVTQETELPTELMMYDR